MKIKFNYILVILLCCQFNFSHAVNIVIDTTFSSFDIYNSLLNNSITNNDFDLNISIKNSLHKDQQLYLSIINPTLDKITIKDDSITVVLGDLVRFSKREFKHINHVYPVLLKENEQKTIILKVSKQWQLVNFRVNLANQNTFIKTTNHDYFFLGIFYGILFMYLLLLICFYIFSKSNFFIIYLIINFFMLLIFLQYSGTGYQFMWFFSSSVQKYITIIAVIGYFASHIYFIRTFFKVQFQANFTGFLQKVLIVVFGFCIIIAVIELYNQLDGYIHSGFYYLLVNALLIIYGIMVTVLCIYTYLESGRREIIWVLIGMLMHFLNWIIFVNNDFAMFKPINYLDNFKFFASNNFIPQINFLITLLEVFVITVFISMNYNKLIKQNNISMKRLEFLQKRNINTFVLGQEAEREKISNQIGIDISNDILHLKKSLLNFNQQDEKKIIANVLNDIDKTLEDIKNITSNYVAPNMQQMKMEELVSTATEKIYMEINMQYDFTKIPEKFQLNAVANINIYRVLQEISNNILKHSGAENVIISVVKDNKTLQIKIIDDGVGFEDFTPNNKGMGLMNIQSRMNSLNGNFYVLSNAQRGCTIHLIMPLKEIS